MTFQAPTAIAAGRAPMRNWRSLLQRTLTEMAAADPGRYVRVDGDGDPDVVSARVREVLAPLVGRALPTSTV